MRINSRDTVLLVKPELFSAFNMKVFSCLDQYVDWWDRPEENPEPLLSLRSIQSESKMCNKDRLCSFTAVADL